MNNGQMRQFADSQDFFTPGVGNTPANQNNYEPENNVNLDNDKMSWEPPTADQDMRSLGDKITSLYGEDGASNVNNVSSPDYFKQQDTPEKNLNKKTTDLNRTVYYDRSKDGKPPKSTMAEIGRVDQLLDEEGNASDYCESVMDIREVYSGSTIGEAA